MPAAAALRQPGQAIKMHAMPRYVEDIIDRHDSPRRPAESRSNMLAMPGRGAGHPITFSHDATCYRSDFPDVLLHMQSACFDGALCHGGMVSTGIAGLQWLRR